MTTATTAATSGKEQQCDALMLKRHFGRDILQQMQVEGVAVEIHNPAGDDVTAAAVAE